ncbi:MAG: RNA pseudouridine synthase [Clostridia bacterium]|nr:RNA pseudouridine synthase [Clostridia bacterium]
MLNLLYNDKYLIVCVKPTGVLSEPFLREKNMPGLLKKQTGAYKIDVIHRLDRNVGGVMVYSKSSKATVPLAKMMSSHKFTKEYLAVVKGTPEVSGTFQDYLVKDKKNCKVYVTNSSNKDAKFAKLDYQVLAQNKGFSLVKIRLHTGRTHQIRVQFASRGFYLVGDTKYGNQNTTENGKTPIALYAYHLAFLHPISKQEINFVSLPEMEGAFSLFKKEIQNLK